MYTDKWNYINEDYKRNLDYHKGTGHNASYWDLTIEECDRFHLPKQCNEDCYNVIN
jgi:hypothetical protein